MYICLDALPYRVAFALLDAPLHEAKLSRWKDPDSGNLAIEFCYKERRILLFLVQANAVPTWTKGAWVAMPQSLYDNRNGKQKKLIHLD